MQNRLSERGYSLVEVLASMVIVMVLLLPVMGYFTDGYRGVKQSGDRTQVVTVAGRTMESLYNWMNGQWKTLSLDTSGNQQVVDSAVLNIVPPLGVQITVSYTYDSDRNGWNTRVACRWRPNGADQDQTYVLTSFYGDYDHDD